VARQKSIRKYEDVMVLLGGRYAPMTESIGFLEASFEEVLAADRRWRLAYGGYTGRPVNGPLPVLLDSLLPLTAPLLRRLWVQTTGRWTAYFDNQIMGSDTQGPLYYLAQQLGCRGAAVCFRPATDKRGQAVILTMYGPQPTEWLNIVRSISAVQDSGRWEWKQSGSVQPFEEVDCYEQRRVRDRFTPQMLERYAAALEIRPFDDSFYAAAGQLIESPDVHGQARTLSLAEARAWHGLE
jgi:hypothetical protein